MLERKTTSSELLGYEIAVISQAASKAKKQQLQKNTTNFSPRQETLVQIFRCCCLRLVKQEKLHANSALQPARGVSSLVCVGFKRGACGGKKEVECKRVENREVLISVQWLVYL